MKNKNFLLPLILIPFALLYMATKIQEPCLEDCQKLGELSMALQQNRPYIYAVYRCSRVANSDTLCISVSDSVQINWNSLADTACALATQKGLLRQKIFIINNRIIPIDTLAVKICP